MRGAIRLALCLLGLLPARADDGRRSRLLVAYVAGRDAVSEKRIGPVLDIWRGMHREYPRWSLRCLLVTGGARTVYTADATCARLALDVDDSYLALGHKVKALLSWVAAHQPEPYDFLLKTDVDTLICFTMALDMIDATVMKWGTSRSIYMGHSETCSHIVHDKEAPGSSS